MIKNAFILLSTLLFIFPAISHSGNAYYVDCDYSSNGDGSYRNPWNDIEYVNKKTFEPGDDVYFKVNTICKAKDIINIDWTGKPEDPVIIGAYYGENIFGLNNRLRPIIDGDKDDDEIGDTPSLDSYRGLITIDSQNISYVKVMDLKIQYSGHYGVLVQQADHVDVENCHIYRSRKNAIVYTANGKTQDGVEYGHVSKNICEEAGHPDYVGSGAGIEISSNGVKPVNDVGATHHIVVSRNKVINCKYEGIGFYRRVTDCIAEYNIIRDIASYMLYSGASRRNIFRFNLIYETGEKVHSRFNESERGIFIDNEEFNDFCFSASNEVYGNMIAGTSQGINLSCQKQECNCHEDTKVYNNTIIGAKDYSIKALGVRTGDSVEIKNNLSWTLSENSIHMSPVNSDYIEWSNNFWDDGTTGSAAKEQIVGSPKLIKSSNWTKILPDELDGSEFGPQDGSPVIDAGISIGGDYNKRIISSNFKSSHIEVGNMVDIVPDVGAWMYLQKKTQNIQVPSAPENTKIEPQ